MSDGDRRALAAITRILTRSTADPDGEAREILTVLRGHGWPPRPSAAPSRPRAPPRPAPPRTHHRIHRRTPGDRPDVDRQTMTERCGICDRPDHVTYSPLWGPLCVMCTHIRTEQLLIHHPITELPVRPADLEPTSHRPHP